MQKFWKLSSLFLVMNLFSETVSFGFSEQGGHSVGNGGKGVICRDSEGRILSIELLDFYEARVVRGIQRDLGAPSLSVSEKIRVALERLARLSPQRAREYQAQADRFFDEVLFLRGQTLIGTDDSDHISFPSGCAVEQMATQNEPRLPEDKRYTINQDLWERLDSDNQTGLILHEIIYREAIESGQNNSRSSRYINSYITSKKIDGLSPETFTKILQELGFQYSEIQGVWLSLFRVERPRWEGEPLRRVSTPPEFYPNGNLRSGWSKYKSTLTFGGVTYVLNEGRFGHAFPSNGPNLYFYENGVPQEIHVFEAVSVTWQGSIARIQFRVTFHPNGRFRSFSLSGSPFRAWVHGLPLWIVRDAEWDLEGRLLRGYPDPESGLQRLRIGDGRSEVFVDPSQSGREILFHPNGVVRKCWIQSGTTWIEDQEISLDHNRDEYTELYPDGTLSLARVRSGRVRFKGKWISLKPGSILELNEDGTLKGGPRWSLN